MMIDGGRQTPGTQPCLYAHYSSCDIEDAEQANYC